MNRNLRNGSVLVMLSHHQTHYQLAISSDLLREEGPGGITTIYSVTGRKACPKTISLLRPSLTADSNPDERGYHRQRCWGSSRGSYAQEYTKGRFVEERYVDREACLVFLICNSQNSGLVIPSRCALFRRQSSCARNI